MRHPQRSAESMGTRTNSFYSNAQAKLRRQFRRYSRDFANKRYFPIFVAICIVAVLASLLHIIFILSRSKSVGAEELVWLVGVSRVDITPTEPVWLSGFASRNRTAEATTPLDPAIPLYARVFSLRPRHLPTARASPLVIVALDLIGLDRAFSDRVQLAAAKRHGLEPGSLHLITSHTHSGPVVGRNLAPLVPDDPKEWEKIEHYADFLFSRILAAIAAALRERSLVLAAGRFATGEANLAVNRRQVKESEYNGLRRGDTDDAVPVMWFTRQSGDIMVGLFGYAAHATVLTSSYRYSGDYPSLTSDALERRYPGSRWLFLPGCGGDQNMYPRGTVIEAKKHALSLRRIVSTTMYRQFTTLQSETLSVRSKTVALPFEKVRNRKDLRELQRSGRIVDRRAATELLRNVPMGGMTEDTYNYPVATANIGGIQLAFLGGEPTVGFCHAIRKLGFDWVVGYCDDVMGYVATDKARQEGGREGSERAALYYGLPAAWRVGIDQTIIHAVRELRAG